jgi:hypothetical protein
MVAGISPWDKNGWSITLNVFQILIIFGVYIEAVTSWFHAKT